MNTTTECLTYQQFQGGIFWVMILQIFVLMGVFLGQLMVVADVDLRTKRALDSTEQNVLYLKRTLDRIRTEGMRLSM